ncbi:MAG: alpha/beta hydrolase [Anaerolineae bacterium]|nr:alpha/beta hydrolase [Anaerolineae bacterium]
MSDQWQDYPVQEHTVHGTVRVLPELYSPQLDNARSILVYLPSGYEPGEDRYPVLYMHDGQNLFDAYTSFAGEWHVDETLLRLETEGIKAIVVGIPNGGSERVNEYSPFRDPRHGGGKGDRYLDFLADTLKPRIDADFRTLPGRDHTGLMGSSMGGLISLYGYFYRPETFGFAGAMSPAFWFAQRAIFPYTLRQRYIPGRIYLDAGTAEIPRRFGRILPKHVGQPVCADAQRMLAILSRLGFEARRELNYVEGIGAAHNETAWSQRLPNALRFLLGPLRDGYSTYD